MSPDAVSCRRLVESISDYLDGALSPADRRRFEEHLAACPQCRGYASQMRGTIQRLGRLPPESLPTKVERELLRAFRDRKRSPHPTAGSPRPRELRDG